MRLLVDWIPRILRNEYKWSKLAADFDVRLVRGSQNVQQLAQPITKVGFQSIIEINTISERLQIEEYLRTDSFKRNLNVLKKGKEYKQT